VTEGDGANSPAAPPERASCLADPEDELSDAELARLEEALLKGFESIKAGRFRAAVDVISDLRRG